jgi:hypothetical protein
VITGAEADADSDSDESNELADGSGGAAPASPELPIVDCPDVALETGRAGWVSSGLGESVSFMVLLLLLMRLHRECQPFMWDPWRRPVRGP